ncbi:MAG: kynureninase [Bacteroidota bacterium]|jgi:kynureninase
MLLNDTPDFALAADAADPLRSFRDQFLIPSSDGQEIIYLCGNSLGLQPKTARKKVDQLFDQWQNLAVEGWFEGETPWMTYHKELQQLLAPIMGAKPEELVPMNSLTVNLHLLMVSFYRPNGKRNKILMEGGAFPSDQYAVESHLRALGIDPEEALIEVHPRVGEETLRTEDILSTIHQHAEELALVLFGGINYYTGQFFDLEAITRAGQQAGAKVGFDLAHAAGNVPLSLHDWGVDFACWCSYKYMNSSPGGISGVFVHEKHFNNSDLPRFAGWWGYQEATRFKMQKGFVPEQGAEGWLLSCSPMALLSIHKASLEIFQDAGGLPALRKKSEQLTAYLSFWIHKVNEILGVEQFRIITPEEPKARGCQLSLIARKNGKQIFDELVKRRIVGDWREPNVIRMSPVPLYNSFQDVYRFGTELADICKMLHE